MQPARAMGSVYVYRLYSVSQGWTSGGGAALWVDSVRVICPAAGTSAQGTSSVMGLGQTLYNLIPCSAFGKG